MSLEAYRRSQAATESPRETEYRLFAQVTAAMIEARDKGYTGAKLMESLDWNRRLWSTLAVDCASPDNRLPEQTRAQIISLSIYISKTTSEVMLGRASIDDLIAINRIIMEGLAASAQNGPEAGREGQETRPLPTGGITVG